MGRKRSMWGWHGEPQHFEAGDCQGWLPMHYHDAEAFMSLHTADFDAVAAALPSDAITPVRWIDGRALVMLGAFRWPAVTWSGPDGSSGRMTPYGEFAVNVMVTVGSAPRVLPLVGHRATGFTLYLPVTSREARDFGRILFGLPKFLASMDFTETPHTRSVRVSDSDQHILTLTVHPSGPVRVDSSPIAGHVSVNGELRECSWPSIAHQQVRFGSGGGALELGTHPVAQEMRGLGIALRPLAVASRLRNWTILPPLGPSIGPARDVPVLPGRDDDLARYTVTYPGAEPMDLYAMPAGASRPSAAQGL